MATVLTLTGATITLDSPCSCVKLSGSSDPDWSTIDCNTNNDIDMLDYGFAYGWAMVYGPVGPFCLALNYYNSGTGEPEYTTLTSYDEIDEGDSMEVTYPSGFYGHMSLHLCPCADGPWTS
jgi:hypothetical protein